MGGGHCKAAGGEFCVHKHPCQTQTFCHGGAGAVQPEEGQLQLTGGIRRADTLVEQVTRKQKINLFLLDASFLQSKLDCLFLHQRFRLFPGFFAEGGILRQVIEVICQRTFLFLLCTYRRKTHNAGRMVQLDGPAADTNCHLFSSYPIIIRISP